MANAPGAKHDATVTEHRDRILDWEDELVRLAPDLPSLPEAARQAVVATVTRFLDEDAASLTAVLDAA